MRIRCPSRPATECRGSTIFVKQLWDSRCELGHAYPRLAQVLTATNNKGLGESYITQRVRQWEEVHPFATGWAPRPRDAAKLLHRYRQLREALHEADRK
ncbi:hypothetical protein HPB51_021358 [Rhipicephalus microplus]|uniref:Uncharacterized protein n=1 Tax=Rhipicephalus microplus TaxID=6941 RepID=A0A9J6F665_RHIMP|nr:hypothetical protein HPB51_021358 [Rhipicephalus microplus]